MMCIVYLNSFLLYQSPVFTINNQSIVNELFLLVNDQWGSSDMDLHRHHLAELCYYNIDYGWVYLYNTMNCIWRSAISLQLLGIWKPQINILSKLVKFNGVMSGICFFLMFSSSVPHGFTFCICFFEPHY